MRERECPSHGRIRSQRPDKAATWQRLCMQGTQGYPGNPDWLTAEEGSRGLRGCYGSLCISEGKPGKACDFPPQVRSFGQAAKS